MSRIDGFVTWIGCRLSPTHSHTRKQKHFDEFMDSYIIIIIYLNIFSLRVSECAECVVDFSSLLNSLHYCCAMSYSIQGSLMRLQHAASSCVARGLHAYVLNYINCFFSSGIPAGGHLSAGGSASCRWRPHSVLQGALPHRLLSVRCSSAPYLWHFTSLLNYRALYRVPI